MFRRTDDLRIRDVRPLIPPAILLEEIPISEQASNLVFDTRMTLMNIIGGADRRLALIVGPCSIHDTEGRARVRRTAEDAGRPLRRPPRHRHADLLREAAHLGRLEGADQRSRSGRELPHQQRPSPGPPAAARPEQPRHADRVGISRHPDSAAHRRPHVVGRDWRAHGREPGAPRARVRALDAGRLQEQHRRQHRYRRRCRADRAIAALVSVGHQAGCVGDLSDRGQRRLPRHSPRRHADRTELRRRTCGQGVRAAGRSRAASRA